VPVRPCFATVQRVDTIDDIVTSTATEHDFSGAVRVDDGDRAHEWAFGLADRGHAVHNRPDTRFGLASGTKGFTALTVMSLIESGELALDQPVRTVLGRDLSDIDDRVTIEHLLAHRSGIGDYLDESELHDVNDYLMPVPVHELSGTDQYLPALAGHPQVFEPDERFAYNNSGYVVLALVAQRVANQLFEQLVTERVCVPAGLTATAFLRSDELPGDAAIGYLSPDDLRTNVFHLPVMGSGDGGIFSTAADMRQFWSCLFEGRIVSREATVLLTAPHSDVPEQHQRYGLGFWLAETGPVVSLEGCDAGVSFRSVCDPSTGLTHSVLSNTSTGAWPMTKALDRVLGLA
jgi:CubicO group peptidase (beta-lactamase class C family)